MDREWTGVSGSCPGMSTGTWTGTKGHRSGPVPVPVHIPGRGPKSPVHQTGHFFDLEKKGPFLTLFSQPFHPGPVCGPGPGPGTGPARWHAPVQIWVDRSLILGGYFLGWYLVNIFWWGTPRKLIFTGCVEHTPTYLPSKNELLGGTCWQVRFKKVQFFFFFFKFAILFKQLWNRMYAYLWTQNTWPPLFQTCWIQKWNHYRGIP